MIALSQTEIETVRDMLARGETMKAASRAIRRHKDVVSVIARKLLAEAQTPKTDQCFVSFCDAKATVGLLDGRSSCPRHLHCTTSFQRTGERSVGEASIIDQKRRKSS